MPAILDVGLTKVVALFSWWSLVRFAHVLFAVLWVGGQLTLSLVVRRAAVETLEDETRSTLFTNVGRSFGRMANFVLMPVLLGTGLALIYHRGVDIGGARSPSPTMADAAPVTIIHPISDAMPTRTSATPAVSVHL